MMAKVRGILLELELQVVMSHLVWVLGQNSGAFQDPLGAEPSLQPLFVFGDSEII